MGAAPGSLVSGPNSRLAEKLTEIARGAIINPNCWQREGGTARGLKEGKLMTESFQRCVSSLRFRTTNVRKRVTFLMRLKVSGSPPRSTRVQPKSRLQPSNLMYVFRRPGIRG